jgi:ribosomal protein L11 methyltransferase
MRELVLICPEAQAETLSDVLLDAGVLSVSVEDADIDTERESPLFGEPGLEPDVQAWHRNRVVALLSDGLDPSQVLEEIRVAGVGDYQNGDWSLRDVPDADWVRLTQAQFKPIQVGDRVWIVPSWHRDDPAVPRPRDDDAGARKGTIQIELDPGLAFGTGSHPTTHLCLEWLESHVQGGESVLD